MKCFAAIVVLISVLLIPILARADEVSMKDGTKLDGKILAYDGDNLVVQTGQGRVNTLPMPDVASFVVDASFELSQKMDRLQQDMSFSLRMLDRLALSWEQGKETIRTDIYDLSPISKVYITERRASMKANDLLIEGRIKNDSAAFLRNVLVRVFLLDNTGQVVFQKDSPLTMSVVAAGQSVRFRVSISNPPRFDSYDLQVVGGDSATLQQLEGQMKR